MATRFTIDTNVLIYAVDRDAGYRHRVAAEIVTRAAAASCVLTVQALAEFFHVATRKGIVPKDDASMAVDDYAALFPLISADETALRTAIKAATTQRIPFWDAMLLATSACGGCEFILSEDMAEGMTVAGCRIVSPFSARGISPAAAALLGAG